MQKTQVSSFLDNVEGNTSDSLYQTDDNSEVV